LSAVHVKAERLSNNDLLFGWIRRGRVDADSWLGEEIPLGEEREAYQVEIWSSDVLVRSVQVQAASWIYPGADRLSDLGSSDFQLRVAMVSSKIGAGDFACIDISSRI